MCVCNLCMLKKRFFSCSREASVPCAAVVLRRDDLSNNWNDVCDSAEAATVANEAYCQEAKQPDRRTDRQQPAVVNHVCSCLTVLSVVFNTGLHVIIESESSNAPSDSW